MTLEEFHQQAYCGRWGAQPFGLLLDDEKGVRSSNAWQEWKHRTRRNEGRIYTVHAVYPWDGSLTKDEVLRSAAGRRSSYSGVGFGQRDMGWWDLTEIEAQRIMRAIQRMRISAEIKCEALQ